MTNLTFLQDLAIANNYPAAHASTLMMGDAAAQMYTKLQKSPLSLKNRVFQAMHELFHWVYYYDQTAPKPMPERSVQIVNVYGPFLKAFTKPKDKPYPVATLNWLVREVGIVYTPVLTSLEMAKKAHYRNVYFCNDAFLEFSTYLQAYDAPSFEFTKPHLRQQMEEDPSALRWIGLHTAPLALRIKFSEYLYSIETQRLEALTDLYSRVSPLSKTFEELRLIMKDDATQTFPKEHPEIYAYLPDRMRESHRMIKSYFSDALEAGFLFKGLVKYLSSQTPEQILEEFGPLEGVDFFTHCRSFREENSNLDHIDLEDLQCVNQIDNYIRITVEILDMYCLPAFESLQVIETAMQRWTPRVSLRPRLETVVAGAGKETSSPLPEEDLAVVLPKVTFEALQPKILPELRELDLGKGHQAYLNARRLVEDLLNHLMLSNLSNPLECITLLVQCGQVLEQMLAALARKRKRDETIHGHNLNTLLNASEISVSPEESRLVQALNRIEIQSRSIPQLVYRGVVVDGEQLLLRAYQELESGLSDPDLSKDVLALTGDTLAFFTRLHEHFGKKIELRRIDIEGFFETCIRSKDLPDFPLELDLDLMARMQALTTNFPRAPEARANLVLLYKLVQLEHARPLVPTLAHFHHSNGVRHCYDFLEELLGYLISRHRAKRIDVIAYHHNLPLMVDHSQITTLTAKERDFLSQSHAMRQAARYSESRTAGAAVRRADIGASRVRRGKGKKPRGDEGVIPAPHLDKARHEYEELYRMTLTIARKLLA